MRRHTLTALLAASCLAVIGCQSNGGGWGGSGSEAAPSISVNASNDNIVVGDTTTFTLTSRNTLARDAEVRWTSTGGDLRPDENGRIARATFDVPGSYTVSASLFIGGREVSRDSVTVNVRPVR